jgi:hypothetical protein
MVPNPVVTSEPTGPSAVRLVDLLKATLFIDEGDDIFKRKADLRHHMNQSWTKDKAVVWRTIKGSLQAFNFWCPKAIGLLASDMLPRTISSRGFQIKMVPPLNKETPVAFPQTDDDELLVIRRKLARWQIDNADAIIAIEPDYPKGIAQHTRPKANWRMLLQIAQHAGSKWKTLAHDATLFLGKRAYAPSMGIEALTAAKMLLNHGKKPWILSNAAVAAMTADEHSPWNAYRSPGRGPHRISANEFAALLAKYDTPEHIPIQPRPIKAAGNRRGYRVEQFADAWERFADRIARVDVSWWMKPTKEKVVVAAADKAPPGRESTTGQGLNRGEV